MECKAALIHKSSVNCSNYEQHFASPFFVFGEKVSDELFFIMSVLLVILVEQVT